MRQVVASLAGPLDSDNTASLAHGVVKKHGWSTAGARFAKHLRDVRRAVGRSLNDLGRNLG